jgi:hypothetical protein
MYPNEEKPLSSKKINVLIKKVENARYPEDKDAYKRICETVIEIKQEIEPLYNVVKILKEIDNIQIMMYNYLPKNRFSDPYGQPSIPDTERNYINLAREKKKLIATLYKLKTTVENLKERE